MNLIWYNPRTNCTEVGSQCDYEYLQTGVEVDRFVILYELGPEESLDTARKVSRQLKRLKSDVLSYLR